MTAVQGDAATDVRESARGWHKLQLAVLGFIGLCGVLLDGWTTQPRWLQIVAGALVLASLALACLATYLVARAAWPLEDRAPATESGSPTGSGAALRLLRAGIGLTYVSVTCVALATATAWWPGADDSAGADDSGELVAVQSASGSLCGRLADGPDRALVVATDERRVVIPLEAVISVQPVDGC